MPYIDSGETSSRRELSHRPRPFPRKTEFYSNHFVIKSSNWLAVIKYYWRILMRRGLPIHARVFWMFYWTFLTLSNALTCTYEDNQRETRDNRLLGRYLDKFWCHLHTSVKLFGSSSDSMDVGGSIRVCFRSVHGSIGCDQEALHYWGGYTSPCPSPYPTAACPEFHVIVGYIYIQDLQTMIQNLNRCSKKAGLEMNMNKTQVMTNS